MLLSLLAACSTGYSASALPTWVNVAVRFDDGSHGSVTVSFDNPRRPPEIRYQNGIWTFDGADFLQIDTRARESDGQVVHDLSVTDLLAEARYTVSTEPAGQDWDIAAIRDGAVALHTDEGLVWLDARTGDVVAPGELLHELVHFGPGRGFTIDLQGDTASLKLPLREDDGLPLFQGVDEIVAVSWLYENEVDDDERNALGRVFKAVNPVWARSQPAAVDGHLTEWRHDKALAIDTDSHVQDGLESWSGSRDGSFGVAARVDDGRLKLAIRIRDDALLYGQDKLIVQLGASSYHVLTSSAGPIEGLIGANGVFTDAVDFGTGVELSLPLPPPPSEKAALPLVVSYIDVDPEQDQATVLSNAPSMRALAIRRQM